MPFDPGPLVATIVLIALSTWVGMGRVVKIIRVYEAKHELREGSAGFLRSISGWSMIVFWLMTTWFLATVIGDWGVSGDLGGAIDRSMLRLRILLEIAAAIADSD